MVDFLRVYISQNLTLNNLTYNFIFPLSYFSPGITLQVKHISNFNLLNVVKYKLLKRYQGNGLLLSISLPLLLPSPVTRGDQVHTKNLENITLIPLNTVGNLVLIPCIPQSDFLKIGPLFSILLPSGF